MKRFTKNLPQHVLLLERHAAFLVKRFTIYDLRVQKIQALKAISGESVDRKNNKEIKDLYLKMKLIQIELEFIESFIKEAWPTFFKIYETIKDIPLEELTEEESDHQNTF